jgi:hypothetical protein
LIDTKLATAGKSYVREHTPTLVLNFVAANIVLLHGSDELFDVIAYQIELMDVVLLGWMNSDFSRWQTEDKPAAADINVGQFHDIA